MFHDFHPEKGSLLFAASSMVKLIEGWLSFIVDRNASAVSTFSIMLNYLSLDVHNFFIPTFSIYFINAILLNS